MTSLPSQIPSSKSPMKTLPMMKPNFTSTMDFSKFRESGELSDITVVVDENEFKLHKFPLFIKSDFFRALARSKISERDRVELADFPGGAETFELVANYCYNIKVNISNENVCKLRCAAEFLQMTNSPNLADVTDRVLTDALTSAKLARDLGVIVDLLMQCQSLGAIAEQANIVDRCINAIVDCWLISSKFSRRTLHLDKQDVANLQKLTSFPLNWFLQLFITARDKSVRPSVLATMIEMYISNAIESGSYNPADKLPEDQTNKDDEKKEGEKEGVEGEKEDSEVEKNGDETKEKTEAVVNSPKPSKKEISDEDIGIVLDTLLLELPENAPLADTISPEWAARMLQTAAKMSCKSRGLLLKLAARLLHKFTPSDLSEMSPELLSEILREASEGDGATEGQKSAKADMACQVIDSYLLEQAKKDELPVDVFKKMVQAVPTDTRINHDLIFQVLERMIKSEKHPLSEADKKELLEMVDCEKLSESTLVRAYESELVPASYITKAALSLCTRLRQELDNARGVIASQTEQLNKYGLSRTTTSHTLPSYRSMTRHDVTTGASGEWSTSYRTHARVLPSSYHPYPRSPPPRSLYLPQVYDHGGPGHDFVTRGDDDLHDDEDDWDEVDEEEDDGYTREDGRDYVYNHHGLGSRYTPSSAGRATPTRRYDVTTSHLTSPHGSDPYGDDLDHDYSYSSSYDTHYRSRYLDNRQTDFSDMPYVDTYSDLWKGSWK